MDTSQHDPIDYPQITFNDGTIVEVKFRVGDIVRLKKQHEIDLSQKVDLDWINQMERTLTILAAGISHQVTKSTEELADLVDYANFFAVSTAIADAIKKAIPQNVTDQAKPLIN